MTPTRPAGHSTEQLGRRPTAQAIALVGSLLVSNVMNASRLCCIARRLVKYCLGDPGLRADPHPR